MRHLGCKAAVIALLIALALSSTASADVPKPTNGVYLDRITSTSGLGPVQVSVTANGSGFVTITVPEGHTVIVGGYQDEYYLGIGKTGGWKHNALSQTWLTFHPSEQGVPGTGVLWRPEQSPGRTITFHDHRVHWMQNPPSGTGNGRIIHLQNYVIPMIVDNHKAKAEGEVRFRFGSTSFRAQGSSRSSWPWFAAISVLGVVLGAIIAARWRLRTQRARNAEPAVTNP